MSNLWPSEFPTSSKISAKTFLEDQAKLLIKLTNDMVYATVSQMNLVESREHQVCDDFSYKFELRGKFLDKYRFNVLMFSHDVTGYPVRFDIDENIAKEIGIAENHTGRFIQHVADPEELEPFVKRVLRSERLSTIISSMIQLSK